MLHESKSREWDATLTRSPSGTVQRCSTTFQSATSLLRSLNSAVAVWEGRRCLTLSKPRRREGGWPSSVSGNERYCKGGCELGQVSIVKLKG